MRAIHVVQRDDPATGGAVRVAVELVRRLPDFGVSAKCVFVYGPPGHFSKELPDSCEYLGLSSARDVPQSGRQLARLLQREQPHIVHHHDGLTWTHAITRATCSGIRYGHAHLDPADANAPWRHRVASFVHRRTYDRLICISESTRRAWIASGFPPDKTVLIPNGVDGEVFKPATDAQRRAARTQLGVPTTVPVIGYVGRLDNKMKGTDDFVRLLAAMPPTVWGVVTGSGSDQSALQSLSRELDVSARIVFTGALNSVKAVYQAIDVLVMTSHYEPFGLVVLEAAVSGVSVVGFAAHGGLTDLLHRVGGRIIVSRDITAMASAINEILDRETSLSERSQIHGILANQHSWAHAAERLAADYAEAVR